MPLGFVCLAAGAGGAVAVQQEPCGRRAELLKVRHGAVCFEASGEVRGETAVFSFSIKCL